MFRAFHKTYSCIGFYDVQSVDAQYDRIYYNNIITNEATDGQKSPRRRNASERRATRLTDADRIVSVRSAKSGGPRAPHFSAARDWWPPYSERPPRKVGGKRNRIENNNDDGKNTTESLEGKCIVLLLAAAAPQKRCHRRHVVIQNYKKL
ncbi:unnamed protein product [Aphis gossypii]|uniref:Uncharacterized protein n=1 Tax=Aphis gossypii TaxID=80765 RepID=A0A9P0NDC8_APHGO|nr:unnamed protein product [Aphis gossypii]